MEERIIDEFIMVVEVLEAAKDIHDLWKRPGYNFEKLRGYKNRYSMRLGRQYRLEMSIDWTDASCTVGTIGLEDISKHYGGN
jgi:plasmid maintenance system killer protein